jgi:hypothetical protein
MIFSAAEYGFKKFKIQDRVYLHFLKVLIPCLSLLENKATTEGVQFNAVKLIKRSLQSGSSQIFGVHFGRRSGKYDRGGLSGQ